MVENNRPAGSVCKLLTRNGVAVIVAAASPYRGVRDEVRREVGRFVEVHANCSLQVAERRDVKGMYAKARKGEIKLHEMGYLPPGGHGVRADR